ncbi:MAG: DeoR/GlpR transcriptional regulator [Clostridia bacterium]|nr:DeoR/GlpR transcriptional regulator [Clostridia bacterium]
MFANERYRIILSMLAEKQSVTAAELTEVFGVSMETVRRDLAHLESLGRLLRVHGGAVALNADKARLEPLERRLEERVDEKRALAKCAMQFISEHDIVAVDSGSTAIEFANQLCASFRNLTIVTYSKDVLDIVTQHTSFDVRLIGGDYMPEERLFYGFLAEESLRRLRASKCFLFPSAVSLRGGITITVKEYYNLHHCMMAISDHTYILADSSKIEMNAPIRLCDFDAVDAVITDSGVDRQIRSLYRERGSERVCGERD